MVSSVTISKDKVELILSQAMGKVRIADEEGNHIRRPTKDARNMSENFVEWMITNSEIEKLIKYHLNETDKKELKEKLRGINSHLRGSEFDIRKASKKRLEKTFMGFDIFEYEEKFYSFEKELGSGIKIRLTFKMGDFTLAVHMFILLPFGRNIRISNRDGPVSDNELLGSGCYAVWEPAKEEIEEIIEALSYASERHKSDLVSMLS